MLLKLHFFFYILGVNQGFYFVFSEAMRSMHPPGENLIVFKTKVGNEEESFSGSKTSYDEVSIWATERCIPIVREITFKVS